MTTLHDILARAQSAPARPALQAEAGLTYLAFGDLAQAHRSFHARMEAAGVTPGTAVRLRVAHPVVGMIAILSLMSCGATWVGDGEAHALTIADADAPPGAIRIDASWFAADAPEPGDRCALARMRHAGVERDMAGVDRLIRDAMTALPARPGLTTVCASRLGSLPVLAHALATLAAGGAVVFAAPDPGSLVQMATLSQARVAIASAPLLRLLADIMRSGEPLDLCFDAVLAEGPLTPDGVDALRLSCARHVIALA